MPLAGTLFGGWGQSWEVALWAMFTAFLVAIFMVTLMWLLQFIVSLIDKSNKEVDEKRNNPPLESKSSSQKESTTDQEIAAVISASIYSLLSKQTSSYKDDEARLDFTISSRSNWRTTNRKFQIENRSQIKNVGRKNRSKKTPFATN